MKVNSISFSGNIRIKIKDKSMISSDDVRSPTKMTLIKNIADKNEIPMHVGEDVVLFGSSNKLQEQLKEAGIEYTVEENENIEKRNKGVI